MRTATVELDGKARGLGGTRRTRRKPAPRDCARHRVSNCAEHLYSPSPAIHRGSWLSSNIWRDRNITVPHHRRQRSPGKWTRRSPWRAHRRRKGLHRGRQLHECCTASPRLQDKREKRSGKNGNDALSRVEDAPPQNLLSGEPLMLKNIRGRATSITCDVPHRHCQRPVGPRHDSQQGGRARGPTRSLHGGNKSPERDLRRYPCGSKLMYWAGYPRRTYCAAGSSLKLEL